VRDPGRLAQLAEVVAEVERLGHLALPEGEARPALEAVAEPELLVAVMVRDWPVVPEPVPAANHRALEG
jgi:hypothetical protein